MNYLIYIVVGLISGVLSSLGLGGGIILIPILTEFMEYSQLEAQISNLIYYVPTAIVSIYFHNKNKFINIKEVKDIAFLSVIGAIIGSILSLIISTYLLSKIFGIFLLVTGIKQFFKGEGEENDCK